MQDPITTLTMRAAEARAMTQGGLTGGQLMEQAGRAVVDAIAAEWPDLAQGAGSRAVVLCGPGNNGGDGFVIARLLRGRGCQVALYLLGDPARLPPDARSNHNLWAAQQPVQPYSDSGLAAEMEQADLLIDALFGTGLSRPFEEAEGLATLVRNNGARVVAVDMPSGLDADSGRVLGGDAAPRADLTVTFHRPRPGHFLDAGPDHCGRLVVADIGIRGADPTAARLTRRPRGLGKQTGAHKYGHGHVLVLTGGAGRTGAARLSARAALRIGAGLVTLGVPGAAQFEVAAQITALMLKRIDDADALRDALEDDRLNALCLGPGMGATERTREMVAATLEADRAAVLDADALGAFAEAPEDLFALCRAGQAVLTPHGGEFARLFPDLADRMRKTPAKAPAFSRLDAVRAAAERSGAVVLLKGPDTVIAAPDGDAAINAGVYDRAAPWLATAGAGDVLAGMIAGLIARGWAPMQAAEDAAWLHVEAGRTFGPGLIAEDLPEMLPQVLREAGA